MNGLLKTEDLLKEMAAREASDLHIKAGSPPGMREAGKLHFLDSLPTLTVEDCERIATELLGHDIRTLRQDDQDLDFSVDSPYGRLRVSLFSSRGNIGLVLRRIPHDIPSIESLQLPDMCRELARKRRGLVLVTGPTGSGKSTTIAAMLDDINETQESHILTLEDPIEFVHTTKKCFVSQREIGQDFRDFTEALKRSFRQDPDIIMVGELRDLESIKMTMTAAETGHLVLATLHTPSAAQAVDRIIDVFPHEAQSQIRLQLAMSLQGIIAQTLVPKIGGGLAAAHEIMVGTDAVRTCIREGKAHQISNLIQTGHSFGMQSMEVSLCRLVKEKVISRDHALSAALNRKELMSMLTESIVNTDDSARLDPLKIAKKISKGPLINQFR